MKVEVRYYSRSGNTKALAEAIAESLNTKAISIDEENAKITDNVDCLLIGGALYAYGLDKKLVKYIEELDASKIRKAIVFSTSWLSKHSVDLIKKGLLAKNIEVEEKYIYYKNMPKKEELEEAKETVKRLINQ